MHKVFKRRSMRTTLTLVAAGTAALAMGGASAFAATQMSSQTAAAACVTKAGVPLRMGHIGGIIGAVPSSKSCQSANSASRALSSIKGAGDTAEGTPPLIWHGGPVMGTAQTGPIVITPIFWNPAGHPMASDYKNLVSQYISDVAAASGSTSNVYSVLPEYSGIDGSIIYNIKAGTPINDSNALPASGCKLNSRDTKSIYADGTGYDACLDDAQLRAEINSVVTANHLPINFSHIYELYLPKHVESCFNPGPTTNAKNACTINFQPSAAFCAYHSQAPNGTIYANLPFPIYLSGAGFTCGTNVNFPGIIESPNGNPDGDTVLNPTSHETNEAITDPDVSTGWFDSSGFENGDECNFIFGTTQGASGAFFNQVINGHHYLTQEEFSNSSFFNSGGGCLQS